MSGGGVICPFPCCPTTGGFYGSHLNSETCSTLFPILRMCHVCLLNLSSSLKCLFDFLQTDDRLVSGQINLKEIDVTTKTADDRDDLV